MEYRRTNVNKPTSVDIAIHGASPSTMRIPLKLAAPTKRVKTPRMVYLPWCLITAILRVGGFSPGGLGDTAPMRQDLPYHGCMISHLCVVTIVAPGRCRYPRPTGLSIQYATRRPPRSQCCWRSNTNTFGRCCHMPGFCRPHIPTLYFRPKHPFTQRSPPFSVSA